MVRSLLLATIVPAALLVGGCASSNQPVSGRDRGPVDPAELARQGWNPDSELSRGIIYVAGDVAHSGPYTFGLPRRPVGTTAPTEPATASLRKLVISARAVTTDGSQAYVVRRIDGLDFVSKPIDLTALLAGTTPDVTVRGGDGVVVAGLGALASAND